MSLDRFTVGSKWIITHPEFQSPKVNGPGSLLPRATADVKILQNLQVTVHRPPYENNAAASLEWISVTFDNYAPAGRSSWWVAARCLSPLTKDFIAYGFKNRLVKAHHV